MRNKITAIAFIIFILFFGIGFWILPDREFSDMENRNLEQLPQFTVKRFVDGEFTSDFEKYMSDQMIYKDALVQFKVDTSRCIGQKLVNGVFFGKDGYLIGQYGQPDEQLDKNISAVQSFAERTKLPVTFFMTPNVSEIYPEKLPPLTNCYSQAQVIADMKAKLGDSLTFADATDILLAHKEEDLYFKTDHHWNMRGAYYGYTALCEALGIEAKPLSDYEEKTGSDAFYGSLYSKAPSASVGPDTLKIYENPKGSYTVNYVQEGETTNDLYARENLQIKDKYTVFLGGNHPYIRIDSNGKYDENVLVLKDSYAHAMLPFLADTYAHLYVLDLRYFHNNLDAFIEENAIDRIIFIHNVDFISTDVNFIWLE